MPCKRFCLSQKDQMIEDSELCSLSLEIFLRAHHLLKNFVDFFKFHACICDDRNYDKIPLHGALDIMATAMTSIACRNMSKDEFQLCGSFHDTCVCARCRTDQYVPEDIVRKVETILRCLQKSCGIENIMCRAKEVLHALESSSTCLIPERLRNLSFCLKGIMKKVVGRGEPPEGAVYNKQMKLTLNLVDKFIREWSERRCQTRPTLRICRYCDSVISETTRQWGIFCCKNAQRFFALWKEWSLRQSISYASRGKEEAKRKCLEGKQFVQTFKDTGMMYATGQRRSGTSPRIEELQTGPTAKYQAIDEDKVARGIDGASRKLATFDPTIKHPSTRETTRRADAEVSSKKTERERYRVEAEDSTKKTREAKRRRNIVEDEYPLAPDGRRKRDDLSYRSKPEKIRAASRGLRDTVMERAAVGKMRKIRRGGKDSPADRSVKSDRSEMESSVERSKRARKNEKSDRSRRRKARGTKSVDDDDESEGSTYDDRSGKKSKKSRERKHDGMTYDEDREGDTTSRRRRKKPRSQGASYPLDEEEKLRKGGRRHREQTDSESTKKRKFVKVGSAGTEDKSTPESRSKKGTSVPSKKGRKRVGSNGTDDDYSKKSGSRNRKKKTETARNYDMAHRRPIEYQLSNQHFVQLGWTMLPVARTMKKVVQYQTKPAKPHLDWFKKQGYNSRTYYDDGSTVFLNFRQDASGEVFYPNGRLAVEVYRPNDRRYDMCTVFSPGGKDLVGIKRESQIVALFDSMGNGVIFDEDGRTRLSYNQIGGIWRDNPTGVPFAWMWDTDRKKSIIKTVYTEKSAARLEKLLRSPVGSTLKSSGSTKASMSPASRRNKEKKVVEQKPVVAEQQEEEEEEKAVESGDDSRQTYPKDACHFKPICVKLNDFISCRILNRSNINLQFSAGRNHIRIELGTVLDLNKEVASYFVDSSSKTAMLRGRFEKLLSSQLQPNDSLYDIAKGLKDVKRSARQREFMIAKYKPFWHIWKESGSRCRPR